MTAWAQLSSDIGLFLAERLLQYPGLANVDSYPIIVLCRIFTYFYVHEHSSSLNPPDRWKLIAPKYESPTDVSRDNRFIAGMWNVLCTGISVLRWQSDEQSSPSVSTITFNVFVRSWPIIIMILFVLKVQQ